MSCHPILKTIIKAETIREFECFDERFKIAGDFDLVFKILNSGARYMLTGVKLTSMQAGGISSSGIKSY